MAPLRLVLATHNPSKLEELRRILTEDGGLAVELLDAAAVGLADVEETGATFTDNALLKARAATAASGLPSVADDSGLVVDALGGAPGVHSARYAGRHGADVDNTTLVLERLRGVTDRAAAFVCAAALVAPDGREWTTTGELRGMIAHEPRGSGGFGYDPIFLPFGERRTAAELNPVEKDAISHRGKAFRALRPAVDELVAGAAAQSPPPMSTA